MVQGLAPTGCTYLAGALHFVQDINGTSLITLLSPDEAHCCSLAHSEKGQALGALPVCGLFRVPVLPVVCHAEYHIICQVTACLRLHLCIEKQLPLAHVACLCC